MKRVFLALGMLAGATLLTGGAEAGFRDLFCPTCSEFRGEEGMLTAHGACLECGRAPVEVEAAVLTWYWCTERVRWGTEPCEGDLWRHCCTAHSTKAFAGQDAWGYLGEAPWCPACRTFVEGAVSSEFCSACGRPPVTISTVVRTWYWCIAGEKWRTEPCMLHETGQCCSPSAVKMPAAPEGRPRPPSVPDWA